MSPDQPIYGFQAEGVDRKEPLHTRVEEIAARYVEKMVTFEPRGPYYLGGLHFGGIVAFEMAHQLHAAGHEVALVAMFETYEPDYARSSRVNNLSNRSLVGPAPWLLERIEHHVKTLKSLAAAQRLNYVFDRGRNFRKTIKVKCERMINALSYEFYRAIKQPLPHALIDLKALHQYMARKYRAKAYPGRVNLFLAREQPAEITDPTLGWARLACGELQIDEVPGDHGSLLREPHVRFLAAKLSIRLFEAQQTYNCGLEPGVPVTFGSSKKLLKANLL
jgi:aspartate racemase